MFRINENFLKFPGAYLFTEVARRRREFEQAHPEKRVVNLSIGDVTLPLAPAVVEAMARAVREQGDGTTFRGYPPTPGYPFLKERIIQQDFAPYGVNLSQDEVFVNDGAKGDLGSLGDLFAADNVIAVPDPTYPVYVDANVLYGRCGTYVDEKTQWDRVVYLPCTRETDFLPLLPARHADIVYLCFPNNPTGASIPMDQLQSWVDWANEHGAVLVYDAAYEGFITTPGVPHTIYQCAGAKTCAIEVRSYSKTAGFTGCRLGYMVIPMELKCGEVSLNALWRRRQAVKNNGTPYIIQRGAEAIYTPEGAAQTRAQVAFYRGNAAAIRDGLTAMGYEASGGVDSPYVWLRTPHGMSSWDFFDLLLGEAQVVGTPGSGFGPSGEGYFRLTGFGTREDTQEALRRIARL